MASKSEGEGAKPIRHNVHTVHIHDEKSPGNPCVASVYAAAAGVVSVRLHHVLKDDKGGEWPVLRERAALELASALISVAIRQRQTLPGNPEEAKTDRPYCRTCGSEAGLDEDQLCPACATKEEG